MFSFVMYLVVRKSLNLSIGKTAAQVGHSVDMICQKYEAMKRLESLPEEQLKEALGPDYEKYQRFLAWREDGRTKIVLAANEEEWLSLKEIPNTFVVRDAGRTEIESGTETVIGFWPILKAAAPEEIRNLKTL